MLDLLNCTIAGIAGGATSWLLVQSGITLFRAWRTYCTQPITATEWARENGYYVGPKQDAEE